MNQSQTVVAAGASLDAAVVSVVPMWVPEAIRYETDAQSGADVEQLTSEPVTSTNIYPEQRFATADGSRIAIERRPFGQPVELWVCDMRSLRVCRAAQGVTVGGNPMRNAVYFIAGGECDARLMRLDMASLTIRQLATFNGPAPRCGAVSPDERWFVGGPFTVSETVFSLRRIDLATGAEQTLCEIEDMFNPHMQFNPGDGRTLVVQINRGGRQNLVGGGLRKVGSLGATLCAVDVHTGEVTSLPVGRPDTPPISGHECWAGTTGQILFTAGHYQVSTTSFVTLRDVPAEYRHLPPAGIYAVSPGDTAARVVAGDRLYNHLAASDDGRFFIADDHTTGRIYVGSIATGRSLPLCDSHTRQGACQHSHAHAYMTPDLRYVIFNSIVTGSAQVYAARIPDGFLDRVVNA